MPRFSHLPKHEQYRCRECQKYDYGNYFVSKTLCKQCAAKRRAHVPMSTVRLSENVTVTNYVENRLRKAASVEVPKTLAYHLADIVSLTTLGLVWGLGLMYAASELPKPDMAGINWIIGLVWFFLPILLVTRLDGMLSGPKEEWERQVQLRVVEKGAARAQGIQERESFYSSPEWRMLRDSVISEEGRRCNECGRLVQDDADLTVDHILPRSKYPVLALRRDNLRVLCRSCNSAKGNRD